VADLYRPTAFLAILAILAAFIICKLQKNRRNRGFDSRRFHHFHVVCFNPSTNQQFPYTIDRSCWRSITSIARLPKDGGPLLQTGAPAHAGRRHGQRDLHSPQFENRQLGTCGHPGSDHRGLGRSSSDTQTQAQPLTIVQSVTEYLADAKTRELSDATLNKLDIFLRKQFLVWCKSEGYKLLREVDLRTSNPFVPHGLLAHCRKRRSRSA
jgi:hypothetical protein